jgi:hypothetical protein
MAFSLRYPSRSGLGKRGPTTQDLPLLGSDPDGQFPVRGLIGRYPALGIAPLNFRVARDPGANRKEPQEWLVNAGRLHGRNRRRSGALPRQRNVFEDEEGFRVRIQTVRNDPVVFTLKANQRRGLSAASITSAELTTAQYIKKSGQGTWRLRATPPARSALPSHREPSAKQLARIVGNSLRAKHT